ncbi:alpha/beta hydrolase [Deinococcus cellulosilyticus]|uniref:Uncharacterized protein n=1 Tax=Deinococcus cellulosilyticus (strain DSM 18568 / NBRC 106333 / KACC 11606 / 5516J-15) TaxID=1223518 RepID=A0A511MYL7_DEIC1|nr:alpha/beta hydrolase [Deinococcus cellulosilyticus]GEM45694.1 hypothetical protein DC3_13290 [Deinococcus cellulosilyticus NBRC 106333 = KACC 11606]
MNTTLADFPFFPIEFDLHAKQVNPAQQAALLAYLGTARSTDLFVISHGWNNDMSDASRLYQNFFTEVRKELQAARIDLTGRSFAVVGVFWPSKRFTDKDLIPGGAASFDNPQEVLDLMEQLESLRGLNDDPSLDADLDRMKSLAPRLTDESDARDEFTELARKHVPRVSVNTGDEEALPQLFDLSPSEIMDALSVPVVYTGPVNDDGGASGFLESDTSSTDGGAAGLSGFFGGGVVNAARNLLNLTTYYTMKNRAGEIGANALAPVLRTVHQQAPDTRIHLIGHSFGARLVTAAAQALVGNTPLNSMTLYQAAFSHYGFSGDFGKGKPGFFRNVVFPASIQGPLSITHTPNDLAVGIAYPIASMLAGQNASAFGDQNSQYGGLGRNGAQKSDAVIGTLQATSGKYAFEQGRIYNFEASAYIKEHSDICHPETAHLLLSAIAGK